MRGDRCSRHEDGCIVEAEDLFLHQTLAKAKADFGKGNTPSRQRGLASMTRLSDSLVGL